MSFKRPTSRPFKYDRVWMVLVQDDQLNITSFGSCIYLDDYIWLLFCLCWRLGVVVVYQFSIINVMEWSLRVLKHFLYSKVHAVLKC